MSFRPIAQILVMLLLFAIGTTILILSSGCPPKPPPPPDPYSSSYCAQANNNVRSDDVCPGSFTVDGMACVRCPENSGCIDRAGLFYCSSGPCLTDPLCRQESR